METRGIRPIKVLHAPFNFANQPYILSQALRARGVDSHLLRYQWEGNDAATRFQYGEDRVAEISREDWFGDLLRNVQNVAAEKFDIVHFWNQSLLWRYPSDVFNGMDLPFIRLAGPRLAYRFTGYELRRKTLELQVNPYTPYRYGYESRFKEDDQKRYLDYLASYIDAFVVQDPEMQTYCPHARIIPRALDLAQFLPLDPAKQFRNERPLVVHAPSHQKLKGSEFVLRAVDTLKEEGLAFDFTLIENKPNSEALAEYRRADIIIDQLLIGWYGVLSMEAMAMRKTVIAYIRDDLKDYFQNGLPLLNANPDTITSTLRGAIRDHELRREVGRRGRAFVEEAHDSRLVAGLAEDMYKEMLHVPVRPAVPDFSYQISNSPHFVGVLATPAKLRARVRQMAALNEELPALRYKAKRYDDVRVMLSAWRAKANRYDRVVGTRRGRLLLRLLGFRPMQESRSARQRAADTMPANAGATKPSTKEDATVSNRQSDGPGSGGEQPDRVALASERKAAEEKKAPVRANRATEQQKIMREIGASLPSAQVVDRSGEKAVSAGSQRATASSTVRERTIPPVRNKGEVCIVSRKAIRNMTRAPRLAKALVDAGYGVLVVALQQPVEELRNMCPEVEYIEVKSQPLPGQNIGLAWADEVERQTRDRHFDLVQAYDNFALLAAERLATRDGAKLIYDAVELAEHRLAAKTLTGDEKTREESERREEARIFCKADAIITVSDGLADWYSRQYRLPRPLVVRNCRYYWPYQRDDRLRADIRVGPEVPLLVWCGAAYPQQGIEILINALATVRPDVHLVIVAAVMPIWRKYVAEVLPKLAPALGIAHRVHILPARGPNDLVPYISGADIGVIPRSREQLNNFFSMPNKVLEMVMARLPLAVSQLGDIVDLVRKYEMGGVFDERSPADIATVIDKMLEPTTYSVLKTNVMKAAEDLCWEKESASYVRLVGSLMRALLPPPSLMGKGSAGLRSAVGRAAPTSVDPSKRGDLLPIAGPALPVARSIPASQAPSQKGQSASAPPAIVAEASSGPGESERRLVCIVARKRINNITRAPRMAAALVEAGYDVVVVSPALPVPQLQDMRPEVKYLAVKLRAATLVRRRRLQDRRQQRLADRQECEANYRDVLAKGGLRALAWRLGHAGKAVSVLFLTRVVWPLLVATPCALLFKTKVRGFISTWRQIASEDAIELAIRFAMVQHQRALTHGLAEEADRATQGRRFDVVQAYDNYALVAAARLAARDGAKLIYDAIEFTSRRAALNLNILERRRERAERREEAGIIGRADGMIAVADALADWCARHYRRPRPLVVRNCRYYWRYQEDGRLRADAGVGPEVRLLVWIGSLYPQQGVSLLIKLLPHLPPHVHAAIIGFAQPVWKRYVEEELPALAAALGVADRVHFLPEREPNDIVPYISSGDIGVVPGPREHFAFVYTVPNKFLEMIMARLPIAASRLGDMINLIEKYDIGAVFDEQDVASAAAVIKKMLEPARLAQLKGNVNKAAEVLNWERESRPYIRFVDSLMPGANRQRPNATPAANSRYGDAQAAPQAADFGENGIAATQLSSGPAQVRKSRRPIVTALRKSIVPLGARAKRAARAHYQAIAANQKLRETVERMRSTNEFYHENRIVAHYLRFARDCHDRADELKAEAYLAHGVEVLPAADVVANAVGGRVYCDVIEMPSFAERSVAYRWPPTNMSLLNHAFDGYLRRAAGLTTVGWALKEQIEHYGPPVTVIPNYRRGEEFRHTQDLRERCGLRSDDRLILASSTIASGLEPIIEALRMLPDNVHLATLGNIYWDYRDAVDGTLARLGVASRVHLFDPVPYDQFAAMASSANLGLIAVDPSLMHWRISLPNRLFDCIAAGLPIVSPDLQDIAKIIREWDIGVVLRNSDARGWAAGIAAALADEQTLRANLPRAAKALRWETLADKLHAAYDYAASITIFGFHDLVGHQRTIRIADTLVKRGVQVTVCCPHDGPAPSDEMPGVRFVFTRKPVPGHRRPATVTAKPAANFDYGRPAATGAVIASPTASGAVTSKTEPPAAPTPDTIRPTIARKESGVGPVQSEAEGAPAGAGQAAAPPDFAAVRRIVTAGAGRTSVMPTPAAEPDFRAVRRLISRSSAAVVKPDGVVIASPPRARRSEDPHPPGMETGP